MDTTNNDQNDSLDPEVEDAFRELLEKVEVVNRDIAQTGEETRKKMDEIEVGTEQSIKNIEQNLSALDKAGGEVSDELDSLMLQHAEELASIDEPD